MNEEITPQDDSYLLALASRGIWRRTKDRLSKFFFGDDIFISYARADAAEYAAGLAASLTRRRFICYLDQFGSKPDAEIPDELKDKLMRSTQVVLVGTIAAAASPNVRKEIVLFNRTGRAVIAVDADKVLHAEVERAKRGEGEWGALVGRALIEETGERVRAGDPSPRVVDLVENSFSYRRRNQWQRIFLFAGSSFVALAVAAALVVSAFVIWDARSQAEILQLESQMKVADAEAAAERAAVNERRANLASDMSRIAADDAGKEAEGARTLRDSAVEQQKAAEQGMLRAQELERRANEDAAEAARLEEGTHASVLARTPGKDFDALRHAAHAANVELSASARPAGQIVDGLIASVLAADDGIPLRGADEGAVTYTQISPNGKAVFAETYGNGVVGWGVWDAQTGAHMMSLRTPRLANAVNEMTLPQGAFMFPEQKVFRAYFSGDASRLAVIDKDFHLWVWAVPKRPAEAADAGGPQPPLLGVTGGANVDAVSLNDDGSRLLILYDVYGKSPTLKVVDTDKAIRMGDADSAAVETLDMSGRLPGDFVELAAFARDGGPVLCLNSRQHSVLYFPRTKESLDLKTPNTGVLGFDDNGLPIFKLDPRKDREELAGLPADAPQRIVRLDGERRLEFSGYSGDISSAAVVGDRAYVVTINGGQARVHGARADEGFVTLRGHTGAMTRAVLSPDGSRAAVAGGEALLWDTRTGGPLHRLAFSAAYVQSVSAAAFSGDGSRLAMTIDPSSVPEVWDVPAGDGGEPKNLTPECRDIRTAPGHRDPASKMDFPTTYMNQPKAVAFLPDARGLPGKQRLVTMHIGGYVAVWEPGKCQFEREYKLSGAGEHSMVLALSADGATALTISDSNNPIDVTKVKDVSVGLWDLRGLADGGLPVKLDGGDVGTLPAAKFMAAHVSGRKASVLLLKSDGRLELWQSGTGRTRDLGVTGGSVRSAFFSPDGGRVAVLVKDRSFNRAVAVEVWDAGTVERLISIPGDFDLSAGVYGNPVALSADGSRLLAGYRDHTVRVYPTTPLGFLQIANRILAK